MGAGPSPGAQGTLWSHCVTPKGCALACAPLLPCTSHFYYGVVPREVDRTARSLYCILSVLPVPSRAPLPPVQPSGPSSTHLMYCACTAPQRAFRSYSTWRGKTTLQRRDEGEAGGHEHGEHEHGDELDIHAEARYMEVRMRGHGPAKE